jgi:hypothetical protein
MERTKRGCCRELMDDRIGISVPTDVTKNSFFQIHFRNRFGISSRLQTSVTNLFRIKFPIHKNYKIHNLIHSRFIF